MYDIMICTILSLKMKTDYSTSDSGQIEIGISIFI